MTTPRLESLLPLALDMTASLSAADRTRRLVDVVRRALPCDAVALLRLVGDELVPVATHGLSADIHGRTFRRADHPRLDIICSKTEPTRFPADSPLPDPYDGLVLGEAPTIAGGPGARGGDHRGGSGHDEAAGRDPHAHGDGDGHPPRAEAARRGVVLGGHVHSCLGCPLRVEGELVGVLTADALQPGAFDDIPDRFLVHLAALAGATLRTNDLIEALQQRAERQGVVMQDLLQDVLDRRGSILVGNSAAMARLREEIDLVARSGFPVLVTGETGTGKELVVRLLHARSARAEQPLVYVNCAALPESIVESELFGHAKGAFTGAERARLGKFRVADGASLFLDEIGELPLHVQPKLLRALQGGEVQPVGADRPLHVDVRIFAATNRDIEAEVATGRFRADLLHRLDVCRIAVPPLREHRQDVPALAGHFADRARARLGTGPIRFAPHAQALLMAGDWPGNVRELENVISRGVLRAAARVETGATVQVEARDVDVAGGGGAAGAGDDTSDDPHATARGAASARARTARGGAADGRDGARREPVDPRDAARDAEDHMPLRDAVKAYQRRRIEEAVARRDGNWSAAARDLGLDRANLHHLAKRLGLKD